MNDRQAQLLEPNPAPLRVLIADDHPLVRQGWRMVLMTVPEAVLVGEAATGREAVDLAASAKPHVVVLDLRMPEMDGVEAASLILAADPNIAVLVLTQYDDDDSIDRALRAGARGFVLKGAGASELAAALRTVAAGQMTFGAELGTRLRNRLLNSSPPESEALPFPNLTAREREILNLLASGASDAQIARALYISQKTVRNHMANLLPKLFVTTRANAALKAHAAGLGSSD